MTINKSRGQFYLSHVRIFLSKLVFCRGQLYVVVSRVTNRSDSEFHKCDKDTNSSSNTQNVEYKEVFSNVWKILLSLCTFLVDNFTCFCVIIFFNVFSLICFNDHHFYYVVKMLHVYLLINMWCYINIISIIFLIYFTHHACRYPSTFTMENDMCHIFLICVYKNFHTFWVV